MHCGARRRVNVVLLRHLVVQVEQHGVNTVEGIHTTSGRPAEIQGVHVESEETERVHLATKGWNTVQTHLLTATFRTSRNQVLWSE